MFRPIMHVLTQIARARLNIESLETCGRRDLDLRTVSVIGVANALVEAYEAGFRAATAEELGIERVTLNFADVCYAWQVYCTGDRCVQISLDLKDYTLVTATFPTDDRRHIVPLESLRPDLLEIVRQKLAGSGSQHTLTS